MAKKSATKKAAGKTGASKKATPKKATPKKSAAKKTDHKQTAEASQPANLNGQVAEILKQLEKLGHEKVRAMNYRNGAGDNQYGVKNGDIRTMAGKQKADRELALALWATGNFEAQMMCTLLVKAQELSVKDLESMVQTATAPQLADWLHSYVVKEHPEKEQLREKWMKSKDKMCLRAAWRLTAGRMAKSPAGLDPAALLDRIESEMPAAPPEVQWTMNACLAEIGIHNAKLRKRAIAIGEKLGIYRDYPVSKGCTSPFAPIWIGEMVKRSQATGRDKA